MRTPCCVHHIATTRKRSFDELCAQEVSGQIRLSLPLNLGSATTMRAKRLRQAVVERWVICYGADTVRAHAAQATHHAPRLREAWAPVRDDYLKHPPRRRLAQARWHRGVASCRLQLQGAAHRARRGRPSWRVRRSRHTFVQMRARTSLFYL